MALTSTLKMLVARYSQLLTLPWRLTDLFCQYTCDPVPCSIFLIPPPPPLPPPPLCIGLGQRKPQDNHELFLIHA